MKILYVAKHGSGGGDDEGAIAHALRVLGHEVICLTEECGYLAPRETADLCLFHKWDDTYALTRLRTPKVFWYFDLVDFPDPSLRNRCAARVRWMQRMLPYADVGFCTDGDWVARDDTGKLVWLMQGADERVVGRGESKGYYPPILFTGIGRGGGTRRESFVAEMAGRYGEKFQQISGGVYGRQLANRIAGAKIVVAPDFPVTDRYWSNRVYNALGFGAFLLHPKCEGLRYQYLAGREYVAYETRAELHNHIRGYLDVTDRVREDVGEWGLTETKARHLYRHRCEVLIRTLRERGMVP